jgi:hypothetical protein
MPADPALPCRDYVVCTTSPLVAEDIAAGIAEWDPAARVTLCAHPDALTGLLAALGPVAAVVTSVSSAELSEALTARGSGGGVIWLATGKRPAPEESDLPTVPLELPFTTPALHAALDRLARL